MLTRKISHFFLKRLMLFSLKNSSFAGILIDKWKWVINTFINTNVPIFRQFILQARQKKNIKKQKKLTWAAIFFIHVLNWRELKSVRAVSKFTWPLFHKCSPSLHLGDL